jgi:hypothetical protein
MLSRYPLILSMDFLVGLKLERDLRLQYRFPLSSIKWQFGLGFVNQDRAV